MPIEPVECAAKRIDAILGLAEPVSFAFVNVILVHLPALAKRLHHLLRLAAGDARIVRPLQAEKWGADLRGMPERGALAEGLGVVRGVAEFAHEVLAQISTSGVAH